MDELIAGKDKRYLPHRTGEIRFSHCVVLWQSLSGVLKAAWPYFSATGLEAGITQFIVVPSCGSSVTGSVRLRGLFDAHLGGTDLRMYSSVLTSPADDLFREVYCVLGLPIDAIEMPAVLQSIEAAATKRFPFVISTPNLNFLVNSQTDVEFRETLLMSDLCPADGMPIIWIAMLMGIPIRTRIAGSDIFETLKAHPRSTPLKAILFGGTEVAAAAASKKLNSDSTSLKCVGWVYPGFASVDELSQDQFIEKINASNADFLVAALGAKKGQLWLRQNHDRLRVPIRSHLGAVINFQAGTIRRAPHVMQKWGLEWLWRIKEEPLLWKRYWNDGKVLLRLLLTHVLPLMVWKRWLDLKYWRRSPDLIVTKIFDDTSVTVSLSGRATARHLDKVILVLKEAISLNKGITIDFSGTLAIDARFLGLLLMLRKKLKGTGASPTFVGISPELRRVFHLHGVEFLISSDDAIGSRSSGAGKYVDVLEKSDYVAAA